MIGNFFGFIAIWYFILLFLAVFFGVLTYRGLVLPCLGKNGYSSKAAYKRITEYKQVVRAEKILRKKSKISYLPILLLKIFERVSLRSEDLIISASLRQDFCSSSRRRNGRIAGYATVSTTRKTDKKTSQEAETLNPRSLAARRASAGLAG